MISIKNKPYFFPILITASLVGCTTAPPVKKTPPSDIQAVMDKPVYKESTWGLQVVDLASGDKLIDINSDQMLYIGSVRKVFTMGQLLNQVGPDYRYNTPVHYTGTIDKSGVLHGNLILVASGDLTMGGRTNPDGTVAYAGFDHNESNSLGNSDLTSPAPLAGYKYLAERVAQAGIKQVKGNVIIDDRLFKPFFFRGEFNVSPIFVNDDVIDVITNPTKVGSPASVTYRPHSSAFVVDSKLMTSKAGSKSTFALDPEPPESGLCIGTPGCGGTVKGHLPIDFAPPLTKRLPYIQTFRITLPANYARTVFVEALETAGVKVDADTVTANPGHLLPAKNSYDAKTKVAELIGLRESENAKYVLKVSYNIGSDTSLVLLGLTQNVDTMQDALKVEQTNLKKHYDIASNEFNFVDGSGGGESAATTSAVVRFLTKMAKTPGFAALHDGMPKLAVDGSLAFVTDFKSDPTLAGAAGNVYAKPGTYLVVADKKGIVKGQAFGGYITTKSGKQLAYQLVVNNVRIHSEADLLNAFQDQGRISAMLWRDY